MSAVILFVILAAAILLIRRLAEERIACNTCLRVVRRRGMTILADGRLICKECLSEAISAGMQRATAKLPGAEEEDAFALEPEDKRIGQACALCSLRLQPLDPVCIRGDRLIHLSCAQLARGLGSRLRAQPTLPRVLLVEDEQIIRDALVPILSGDGFDCREAADGRSAIDVLAGGTRIDLVLSNLLLPEVDGWTLFLHVRRRFPRIPFVFMTGVRDPCIREAAIKEGAAGFLNKPFEREEFLETVRKALHHGSNPLLG